jgi:hypothetical protein
MIEAADASLLYPPPYSPDFNSIENGFAKLKALLRKAAERTIDRLCTAIGRFLDLFIPAGCRNYFAQGHGSFTSGTNKRPRYKETRACIQECRSAAPPRFLNG